MRRYPQASLSLPSHGGVLMLLPALLSLVTLQQPTAPAPSPPIAKVEVQPSGGEVAIGGRLQFTARALDSVGAEVPRAEIEWFVGARVATVGNDGRLNTLSAGRTTITATSGPAKETLALQVLPNNVARITIEPPPGTAAVRTGDVVKFTATPRTAAGRAVGDVGVEWAVSAGSGVALIDPSGTTPDPALTAHSTPTSPTARPEIGRAHV